jgi:hypothetical protein
MPAYSFRLARRIILAKPLPEGRERIG